MKEISEKKLSPWEVIDIAISYLSYIKNKNQSAWWMERDKGQKQYNIQSDLRQNNNMFFDNIQEDKTLLLWLRKHQINESSLPLLVNAMIFNAIKDNKWHVARNKESQKVKSRKRLQTSLLWKNIDFLRINYWEKLVHGEIEGNKSDQWARKLFLLLHSNYSANKEQEVKNILKKVNRFQPNWEFKNKQSLHVWASNDKRWNNVLSKWGISYKNYQQDYPLSLWAIQNHWLFGFKAWLRESDVSLKYIPNFEEIPETWKKEFSNNKHIPNGSLWHWACRFGDKELIEHMLNVNPLLLNFTDHQNRTGLHWACSKPNKEVVEMLIERGADVSIEDNEGALSSELIPEGDDGLFERLEDLRLKPK